MMRVRHARRLRRALAGAVAMLWASACGDLQGPVEERPGPPPAELLSMLVVSNPVWPAPGLAGDEAGSVSTVYVSLPPGSVPEGEQVVIRHRGTLAQVEAAIVNGGFDPVAIAAATGDTLDLLFELARGESVELVAEVPESRAPVVVRTDPPPQKRDVPLNAAVVVVFSAPIDLTTLTTSSVQLWRGTVPVAGTVRFADALQLRGEFQPDDLLAPETDYRFVVTQGIRDVNGNALASPLEVPFTTGTTGPATGLAFASVSTGGYHACGITTSGQAYCWGENTWGQLGNGTTTGSATPARVLGDVVFQAISAGALSTCGVATSGTAYCWGKNTYGQLGDGSVLPAGDGAHSTVPVRVVGGLTFASVSTGGSGDRGFACGVTISGSAFCWGINDRGQLGAETTPVETSSPVPVVGGLTFAAVSAGRFHACGITTVGEAHCWGHGLGSLGDGDSTGTSTGSRSPRAVVGELTFASVTAGATMSCGVTTSGASHCWGYAAFPTTAVPLVVEASDWLDYFYYFPAPTPVTANPPLATLSISWRGCGLTASGAAYCWEDRGWSGSGHELLPVAGGLTFASVSVGVSLACGVTPDSVAYCWGRNNYGQLGNGTTTDSSVPVKVAGQR